jgi:hypothetical protein
MSYDGIDSVVGKRGLFICRIASLVLLQRLKGSRSVDSRDFNTIETRAVKISFFLQGKAPKEIQAILTETLWEHAPSYAPPRILHHLLVLWQNIIGYLIIDTVCIAWSNISQERQCTYYLISLCSRDHCCNEAATIHSVYCWATRHCRQYKNVNTKMVS